MVNNMQQRIPKKAKKIYTKEEVEKLFELLVEKGEEDVDLGTVVNNDNEQNIEDNEEDIIDNKPDSITVENEILNNSDNTEFNAVYLPEFDRIKNKIQTNLKRPKIISKISNEILPKKSKLNPIVPTNCNPTQASKNLVEKKINNPLNKLQNDLKDIAIKYNFKNVVLHEILQALRNYGLKFPINYEKNTYVETSINNHDYDNKEETLIKSNSSSCDSDYSNLIDDLEFSGDEEKIKEPDIIKLPITSFTDLEFLEKKCKNLNFAQGFVSYKLLFFLQ